MLGVPGGGDIGTFGTDLARPRQAAGQDRHPRGQAPGAPAGLLGARGLSGYLTGASGRELLITVILNDAPLQEFTDIIAIIEDQVRIVETVYLAT